MQVRTFIHENKLPHLLFYGPPGTGKTSTILACARELYGDKFKNMTLEVFCLLLIGPTEGLLGQRYDSRRPSQLNASDDRGIDVVREQIKNFASARTLFSSGFKLIILDEADNMTQSAQNALRRGGACFSSHVSI
jgi:replication factor C subunit 3/5